jgi:predicted transcriptional regulator
MAFTVRFADDEEAALQARADALGISLQDAARRAVNEYIERGLRNDRLAQAATVIMDTHRDAIRRLGE